MQIYDVLVFVAIVALIVSKYRVDAEARSTLRRVDAVLTIWADYWGEPPDVVKRRLREALGRE